MANFVLAYRGGSVPDSEADQQAAMEAWMGWFGSLGDAVVDGGRPSAPPCPAPATGHRPTAPTRPSRATPSSSAGSLAEATELAGGCPVLQSGGSVDVYEAMPDVIPVLVAARVVATRGKPPERGGHQLGTAIPGRVRSWSAKSSSFLAASSSGVQGPSLCRCPAMLQPCMIQTSPPMTTKTWPLTSAASSDASQATRGEMFSGRNRSNWLSSSGGVEELHGVGHRRPGPGGDGVAGHAVGGQLPAEDDGQRGDARLGRGVVGLAGVAEQPGLTGGVDDPAGGVVARLGLRAPVRRRRGGTGRSGP